MVLVAEIDSGTGVPLGKVQLVYPFFGHKRKVLTY